jgi:hypothetical protein
MEKYEFTKSLPEIIDRLQAVSETYLESYDEHKAFIYLIAELFETTSEGRFQFTDGPKDGGIDFAIREPQAYSIAQCKCPSLDNPMLQPISFDSSAVDELKRAITILTDRKGEYDIKPEIKRLRGDYQRDVTADPEGTTLTAILAVLGELTVPARKTFDSYKASLRSNRIFLKLVEWKDIYHALHALEMPSDVDFEIIIHFDNPETDLLAQKDYCYVLAHASDFYDAFRKHEWNLFEWNVRFQIPNSPVNKRIVNTLMKSKGQKFFHHYNNGLLITCKNYKKDITRKRITLKGPQIVNGCQTVRAICEAYEDLSPEEQQHFREKTRVQVKIIQTIDADFIGELVISTNDQNEMNPRNLKSNTSEQREMQKLFRNLPVKWFMQRKDGEFESLRITSAKVRWFKKSDYEARPKRYRVLDNQKLAKSWYSFIGHSHKALMGGFDYFTDETEDKAYTRIFNSIPTPAFWSGFRQPNFVPKEEYFTPGIPSVYQYLLSWGIASYIDWRRISHQRNRLAAIKRGIELGSLKGDPNTGQYTCTAREVDEYLTTDSEYFLNTMLNNMREVLIELYSFVLCNKYTECSAKLCQDLITKLPRHKMFFESACDGSMLLTKQDGMSLIGPIYDFLKDCALQYFFMYQAEIKAAPRLKSYLAQRATINRFRTIVLERNQSTREYDREWKKPNLTFLESLPEP